MTVSDGYRPVGNGVANRTRTNPTGAAFSGTSDTLSKTTVHGTFTAATARPAVNILLTDSHSRTIRPATASYSEDEAGLTADVPRETWGAHGTKVSDY